MAVASTSNIHPLLFDGVTTRDCNSFENDLEELDEQRPDSEEQGTRRPSVYVDSFESTQQLCFVLYFGSNWCFSHGQDCT